MREAVERIASGRVLPSDRYWLKPSLLMSDAGMPPDPWQADVMDCADQQQLLLCARQVGKSQSAGALALLTALRQPGSLTLLLSPTARQSGELLGDKVVPLYRGLRDNCPQFLGRGGMLLGGKPKVMSLEFASGSRILAMPDNPDGLVGYSSVALLVIDEASRASDELYYAVRPMLSVSQGRIVALSTPKGKRGFFFDAWENGTGWRRTRATADKCPRHTPQFLASERAAMGERWYDQEYRCIFQDGIDAVFADEDIQAARTYAVEPLSLE